MDMELRECRVQRHGAKAWLWSMENHVKGMTNSAKKAPRRYFAFIFRMSQLLGESNVHPVIFIIWLSPLSLIHI